jgi:hypothetical protein
MRRRDSQRPVRSACARAGSARSLTIFHDRPKTAIWRGSMSRERNRGASERVRLAIFRDDSGLWAAQDRAGPKHQQLHP